MCWSLVVLAPLSLLASDLPRPLAWTCALVAMLWATSDAARHRLQPVRNLLIPTGHGQVQCDGSAVEGLQVTWRGPLAFLRWQDAAGTEQRVAFWPDILGPGQRRELRLALMRRETAPDVASMAG